MTCCASKPLGMTTMPNVLAFASRASSNETKPGEGRFKLILGSSISGRPIQTVLDSKGASHDVAYVSEDPRTFYVKVESANEGWKFTVDEGFSATIEPKQ